MAVPPSRVINFRAPTASQVLIDHAASVAGVSRTDFILDAACDKAREVLADQTRFAADQDAVRRFNDLLDAPLRDNEGLSELLCRSAPWEE